MSGTLHIQVNSAYKEATDADGIVTNNWHNALKAVALEFQTSINPALEYMGKEPVQVNPDAQAIEDFLGSVNTPPTESEDWEYDGITTVTLSNYSFINARFLSMLPEAPKTFWLISGTPPMVGTII